MPTYSITPSSLDLNEGNTVTFNIATSDVANGTVLYWTLAGLDVNSSDVNRFSGSVTIAGSSASTSTTIANDSSLEGTEFFIAQLRTGSISGPIVAISESVSISDTSTGIPTPTISNGTIGSLSNLENEIVYYHNDVAYKITGTAIPLG